MTTPAADSTHALTRLRLAAALIHQVPDIALTIWCDDGPSTVVSRLARHHPDLSACAFRASVRSAMAPGRAPVAPDRRFAAGELSVDGVGVRHVGDGVVAVEHGEHRGRWWPTLLGADALPTVLAEGAADALEAGLVEPEVVAAGEVAAHVDRELGVTVVRLRTPPGSVPHDRRCDGLARSLARSCVVAEVIEGAGSRSRA